MPRVSVVIPTFNRRETVCEAVATVLSQRDADFETIVVDDGSEDRTAEALAGSVERVRVLRLDHSGVSAARNAGVRAGRGEWIAFLDSDDLWCPGKLAAQMRYHDENPACRISQTGEMWVRNGVRVNPCAHHAKPAGDIFLASLDRCLVSPSAVVIRRDLFEEAGGFDESLAVCEDYDLWLRIAAQEAVGLVPEALVVKRGGHADQLSRAHWGMDRFRVAALARLIASGTLSDTHHQAAIEVMGRKCVILANGAQGRGRDDEAERYRVLAESLGGARTAAIASVRTRSRTITPARVEELCC